MGVEAPSPARSLVAVPLEWSEDDDRSLTMPTRKKASTPLTALPPLVADSSNSVIIGGDTNENKMRKRKRKRRRNPTMGNESSSATPGVTVDSTSGVDLHAASSGASSTVSFANRRAISKTACDVARDVRTVDAVSSASAATPAGAADDVNSLPAAAAEPVVKVEPDADLPKENVSKKGFVITDRHKAHVIHEASSYKENRNNMV